MTRSSLMSSAVIKAVQRSAGVLRSLFAPVALRCSRQPSSALLDDDRIVTAGHRGNRTLMSDYWCNALRNA
jgi:hypothetical protein